MRQKSGEIIVQTQGKGLVEVTSILANWLDQSGVQEGLLNILIQHTSASLTIQENADPDVVLDLADFYEKVAPEGNGRYRHSSEGPDDMPSHIRASLTDVSLSIPVLGGRMRLGTWQGIYVFEHRTRPHERRLALHVMGD